MLPNQPNPQLDALRRRGMRNPNFSTKSLDTYVWDDKKGLPRKENCDLAKPTEMFLWMLVALPGVNGGQQVMPIRYNMVISEHLWELGAMIECPECGFTKEPLKKYQLPTADDGHWMTSPGTWVDPNAPEVKRNPARDLIGRMSMTMKGEILDELLVDMDDDAAAARVVSNLTDKQKRQFAQLLQDMNDDMADEGRDDKE